MTDALLSKARRRWAQTEPVIARLAKLAPPTRTLGGAANAGAPPHGDGAAFRALVESIAHQQVSLAAGRAIYGRVVAACGDALSPAAALAAGGDALVGAGLSRPKTKYVLDLAEKAASGEVPLGDLAAMSDADVVQALTQVKGIGVWTAKMFLIFHLERADVLPHEDLGLQIAVARAYRVPREKAAAKMQRLHPAWSPYASLAALTLWNWRRVVEAAGAEAT